MIAAHAETDKIVVEKSTVPCRTADIMREVLEKTGKPGQCRPCDCVSMITHTS